jgi:hypothetical protein
MRKFLVFLASFLMVSMAVAFLPVWLSSNTATADTLQPLCGQYLVGVSTAVYHSILHEVIVSSAIAATTLTVYNSSFTATSQSIGPIMTSSLSPGGYVYDVDFSNGLSYTKTGTAQVQIIYQCY